MAIAVISNWAGGQALAYILSNKTALWLGLHSADPGVTGLASTEVAGGGYVRQPVRFFQPSGKAVVSSSKLRFTGMPACTVTYVAVWDQQSAGNMIVAVQVSPTIPVPVNGLFVVAPGDIAVQL